MGEEHTSWPRCGWSGNPAPGFTEKWSSMRNGEKFLSCGVPMDLLTRAPAPSDCSTARKALRIARGALTFAEESVMAALSMLLLLLLLVVRITRLSYKAEAVSMMCSLNKTTDKIPTVMESRIAKSFIRGLNGWVLDHFIYSLGSKIRRT